MKNVTKSSNALQECYSTAGALCNATSGQIQIDKLVQKRMFTAKTGFSSRKERQCGVLVDIKS